MGAGGIIALAGVKTGRMDVATPVRHLLGLWQQRGVRILPPVKRIGTFIVDTYAELLFFPTARGVTPSQSRSTLMTYLHANLRFFAIVFNTERKPECLAEFRRRVNAMPPPADQRLPIKSSETREAIDMLLSNGELGAAAALAVMWETACRGSDFLVCPGPHTEQRPVTLEAVMSYGDTNPRDPRDTSYVVLRILPKRRNAETRTIRPHGRGQHPTSMDACSLMLQLLQAHADSRSPRSATLFTWSTGRPVLPRHFTPILRAAVPDAHRAFISTHSVRIGSATDLSIVHHWPLDLVCQFVRWRDHDTGRRYLREAGLRRDLVTSHAGYRQPAPVADSDDAAPNEMGSPASSQDTVSQRSGHGQPYGER